MPAHFHFVYRVGCIYFIRVRVAPTSNGANSRIPVLPVGAMNGEANP